MPYQPDEWLARNYSELRTQRGWSWDQMAQDFDRQGAPELAAWARSLVPAVRESPKARPERAVKARTETR